MSDLTVIYRVDRHGGIQAFLPEVVANHGHIALCGTVGDGHALGWCFGEASLDYYRKLKPWRGPVPKSLEQRVAYNGPGEPTDTLRRRHRLNWRQLQASWR